MHTPPPGSLTLDEVIGELVAARRAARITQIEIAHLIGRTRTAITWLEARRHVEGVGPVRRYAAALDIAVDVHTFYTLRPAEPGEAQQILTHDNLERLR